jgi:hypothetical protein
VNRPRAQEEIIDYVMTHKDACVLWIAPRNCDAFGAYCDVVRRVQAYDFKASALELCVKMNDSKILFRSVNSHLRGIRPTLLVLQNETLFTPDEYEFINQIIAFMPDK